MTHPHDNIRVGAITFVYSVTKRGWVPSSVLTNNSGINERWQTSLIQHQKSKNYSAIQQ
ncbi:DUF1317 family protein [Escherichia coli]|nr:DUF1317 family protein [Escherichia coli]